VDAAALFVEETPGRGTVVRLGMVARGIVVAPATAELATPAEAD